MHLSDQELLTFKHCSPDANQKAHLDECALCRERLDNRRLFAQQLASDTPSFEFTEQWDQLSEHLISTQTNKVTSLKPAKHRPGYMALLATAACVCFAVFIPFAYEFTSSSVDNAMNTKLASSIEENHQLLQNIVQRAKDSPQEELVLQTLQVKLQSLDAAIQVSYVQNLPQAEKLALWENRKEVLMHSLDAINYRGNITTKSI